jgi:hypothetical protein
LAPNCRRAEYKSGGLYNPSTWPCFPTLRNRINEYSLAWRTLNIRHIQAGQDQLRNVRAILQKDTLRQELN